MMVAMDILTFASLNGGTSKTTLAAHLAMARARSGAGAVAVVDTDPRGSTHDGISEWLRRRFCCGRYRPFDSAFDRLAAGMGHAGGDRHAASMTAGHTVGESNPRSRSAEEMAACWQNVTTQLRRQNRSL